MPHDPAHDPTVLPDHLPIPTDDGAAIHLRHARIPDLTLTSTSGKAINLAELTATPTVLFFYPRTGIPGQPPSLGHRGEDWDTIPGARGCTPQSCSFRDLHAEFTSLGIAVRGISTSEPAHQREFTSRMHIPFDMLSDSDLALVHSLRMPTFSFPVESGGPNTLIQRMAWYCENSRIRRVWYPVFPPHHNARTVLRWLRSRTGITIRRAVDADLPWIRQTLTRAWMSTTVRSLGRPYEADSLPAFISEAGSKPVGLITLSIRGRECEVITLNALEPGRCIGTMLMDAALDHARAVGCTRFFLTTSNENLRAMGFYQRFGMRLVAIHRGMIDRSRTFEPSIPRVSPEGVPLHDEVELEMLGIDV